MLNSVLHILFWTVFAYCAASVIYLFVLAICGRLFYRRKFSQPGVAAKKIAILVPAYREDGIIMATAQSLLRIDYPKDLYDVFIITDSFQSQTLSALRELPLNVMEVAFDKSTKTKSLNKAFSLINGQYDIALICDADNILAKDFLSKINTAFLNGARAVQGRRVAKNLDTSFAILDACSEGINNNIFRKGPNAIGLSSSVIGSGMAFEFGMIKEVLSQINAVGGFDKPMQLKIVQNGVRIEYLEDALVFDEKVDSSHAFKQQRKRWVSSQFIYLKKFFLPALGQLLRGNLSYFNLAMGNNLVLPRAFLLMILPMLVLVSVFIGKVFFIASLCILSLYLLTMWIAMPVELINKDLWMAILKLPKAAGIMVGTIFRMKESNKTFIHTVHTKTEINNPLFNEHSK